MSTRTPTIDEAIDDLVAFFRTLRDDARHDYEALAELDRTFGEDVVAEHRERAKAQRS